LVDVQLDGALWVPNGELRDGLEIPRGHEVPVDVLLTTAVYASGPLTPSIRNAPLASWAMSALAST
jgi:hypothetical protein